MAKSLDQVVTSTQDVVLGCAAPESNGVSRWRLHVTAISGTTTVKAKVNGSAATAAAASLVTTVGSTTAGSTITATGFYDIDSAGFAITLSIGTSMSYSAIAMVG